MTMAKKRKKGAEVSMPAGSIDDSWRARDDLSTIQRAHEIVADTKRFGAAKSEAKRQKESLDRIARLEGKKL
jgi:hypothetical protein